MWATTGEAHSELVPGQRQQLAATFSSPPGCGSREQLVGQFEARVPELSLVFETHAPVQFIVSEEASGIRAQLIVLLEDGQELSRYIEANSCEAAVNGIAFVAAVALDPRKDDPVKPRQMTPEPPPSEVEVKKVDGSHAWQGSLGVGASVVVGAAPEPMWGASIVGGVSSSRSSWWAPSLRVGVSYVLRGGMQEPAGVARFSLATVAVDLCPSQWLVGRFRGTVCGALEVGVLGAEGQDTYLPQQSRRLWLGAGPALGGDFRIAGPFWASSRFVGLLPFSRDEYRFDEDVFFRVAPAVLRANLGILTHF